MVQSLAAGAGAGVPLFPGAWKSGVRAERLPDSSKRYALRGMVPSPTPKRDHCDPQSFRLRSEGKEKLVRAEGLEPSRALRPNGFSYPSTAFAAPAVLPGFGVWTIPSPCPGNVSSFQVLPV